MLAKVFVLTLHTFQTIPSKSLDFIFAALLLNFNGEERQVINFMVISTDPDLNLHHAAAFFYGTLLRVLVFKTSFFVIELKPLYHFRTQKSNSWANNKFILQGYLWVKTRRKGEKKSILVLCNT